MGRIYKSPCGRIELREGRWEEVLADVEKVEAIVTDPPYNEKTHSGHDAAINMVHGCGDKWERPSGGHDVRRPRSPLCYSAWGESEIADFVSSWCGRSGGWFVCLSDSVLTEVWRAAFESAALRGFHPLPCVIPGMSVRLAGDGPSSWAIYANVARPRAYSKWGTLQGAYVGKQGEREHIGSKPLWLMSALVRDYSRPNDLICDPCAGSGTTLLAAAIEGRRAIGAEMCPKTFDLAVKRLTKGYTPSLF